MFKVRLKSFENIENPYKIQKPDYNTSKQIAFSQWLHEYVDKSIAMRHLITAQIDLKPCQKIN